MKTNKQTRKKKVNFGKRKNKNRKKKKKIFVLGWEGWEG